MERRSAAFALFAFTRAASAAAIGMLVFLGWRGRSVSTFDGLAAAVPFILAVIAGGVLNDYYDRARDAIDKPWRAIPSGLITPSAAAALAVGLFAGATVLTFVIDYTPRQRLLVAATLAGAGLYNVVVRYAGVLKAPYVGTFSALPIGVVLEPSHLAAAPLCIATAMFVAGREMLMDILDVRGDLADGSRTLPMSMGSLPTAAVAFGLQVVALAAAATVVSPWLAPVGHAAQVASWIFAASCVLTWIAWPQRRRLAVYAMWVPLFLQMAVVVSVL